MSLFVRLGGDGRVNGDAAADALGLGDTGVSDSSAHVAFALADDGDGSSTLREWIEWDLVNSAVNLGSINCGVPE